MKNEDQDVSRHLRHINKQVMFLSDFLYLKHYSEENISYQNLLVSKWTYNSAKIGTLSSSKITNQIILKYYITSIFNSIFQLMLVIKMMAFDFNPPVNPYFK